MHFLEKLWKMSDSNDIQNFLQQKKRRNYLVSKSNFHTTKFLTEKLSATEMSKTEMRIKTPVYLGLSIPKLSKILMYELWYDYVKQKRGKKVKLCYMDTDNFILYIKTDDIY